jgi:hypothetical protein
MSQHRRVQQPIVKMGFPSMSVDELCACLAALGIAAQPEDLNKPTTQSAQAIWRRMRRGWNSPRRCC